MFVASGYTTSCAATTKEISPATWVETLGWSTVRSVAVASPISISKWVGSASTHYVCLTVTPLCYPVSRVHFCTKFFNGILEIVAKQQCCMFYISLAQVCIVCINLWFKQISPSQAQVVKSMT